jgi:AraC-like DNA-binding protein
LTVGAYLVRGEISRRLLDALPVVLRVESGETGDAVLDHLATSPPRSPLTYLTRWRMTLAADLLVEREAVTIADVARAVGYSEPFGFSTAYKRVRGTNPSEFRRTAAR